LRLQVGNTYCKSVGKFELNYTLPLFLGFSEVNNLYHNEGFLTWRQIFLKTRFFRNLFQSDFKGRLIGIRLKVILGLIRLIMMMRLPWIPSYSLTT